MPDDILITSFAPWKPQQRSNASDDLLARFIETEGDRCRYLRRLPVDGLLSPRLVLEAVERFHPRLLLCCGMAEGRSRLSLETQAVLDGKVLRTDIDTAALTAGLRATEISRDAGNFVCNTLYYRCLEYLQKIGGDHHCLFLHVPVLSAENTPALLEDFRTIVRRLAALRP